LVSEQVDIELVAANATEKYRYFLKEQSILVRRTSLDGPIDRLVNGHWVPFNAFLRQPLHAPVWEELDARDLWRHAWDYLILNFEAEAVGWRQFGVRLRRSGLGRLLTPPLEGGASGELSIDDSRGARQCYEDLFGDTGDAELIELKEQAERGLEQQQSRCAMAEQRANFFLTAAGLTTSLVLANAGLLLGTGRLSSPWLQFAAVALGLASVCAVIAGFFAVQATSYAFGRTPPHMPSMIEDRARLAGSKLTASYLAALLVAAEREHLVGDWKVAQLATARRWFFGTISGIVLLTAFVLVEVLVS
jgi:hypothetical protein